MLTRPTFASLSIFLTLCLMAPNPGCYTENAVPWQPDQPGQARTAGQVYYLDGAGGGGRAGGWGRGVRKGLDAAGYQGDFHDFPWQTRMGVVTDQVATLRFKRAKAEELARQIHERSRQSPAQPIDLIGLSAGTAVAVFALEALPDGCMVDNVILLGSSLSSNYDVSSALKHVRNRMYVFTSNRDTVLRFLVPISGTADRQHRAGRAAGLGGLRLPLGADLETQRLYAKVVNVAWNPDFERAGNYGGHTAVAGWRFVRDYVAPLILQQGPRFMRAGARPQWATQTTAPSSQPREE